MESFLREIKLEIFSHFEYNDLLDVSLICKDFYSFSHEGILWKNLLKRDFKIVAQDNYRYNYIVCFFLRLFINQFEYNETLHSILREKTICFDCAKYIPNYFRYFNFLEKLEIQWTDFSNFPKNLLYLRRLKFLNFSANCITSLPKEICFLDKLEKLFVYESGLETIPNTIINLKNLVELDLLTNKISKIPECLGMMKSIKILWLGQNPIKVLENIPPNIEKLHMCRCLIEVIPESITKLRMLKKLNLWENKISVVPSFLDSMTELISVKIWGNNIILAPRNVHYRLTFDINSSTRFY